ncbi:FUSC family protein [Micromonospora inaquosa]|uniref:FUSC family protein n=1 Tax=Micromonospora inaquosa TaxID=2203716 RepID=A0A3N9WP08_9ACTN|nr:FUSC family protein [Micromonospora inaquosa]
MSGHAVPGGHTVTTALRVRLRHAGRTGRRRLETYLIVAAQAGLAATLAWLAARELLGNQDPTFAPAEAVGVIAAALGNRARRTVELVVGVLLGIFVGDTLVEILGTGPWQTGVIVFLSAAVAAAARGTGALMTQAGGTAVLVATVTPTSPDLEWSRTANATVGGAIGLLVVLVLAPLNPMRTVRRVADPTLNLFAREMTASAEALARADARAAQEILHRMRAAKPQLERLSEAVTAAEEVVRLPPVRWRRRRTLAAYGRAVEHMDRAFRNSQAMVRRIGTTLRDEEPVPADLPAAVERLGEAVRMLHREFLAAREPVQTRERVLSAVREAGEACRQDIGFSGTIVVAQLRTVANDMLRATGVSSNEARRMVRRAAAG